MPGLLLAILGIGVLLNEYAHVLVSIRPLPERTLEIIERFSQGERRLVLIVVVIMPIVEEFLFRGLVLRALLALQRPVFAVPFGAAMFAAFHLNMWQLLPAFCMGLLLGWIYAATRSLLTCILGHMIWNAQPWVVTDLLGSPVRGYWIDGDPGRFPQQPAWWLILGTIALISGLYALRSQLRSSSPPTERA